MVAHENNPGEDGHIPGKTTPEMDSKGIGHLVTLQHKEMGLTICKPPQTEAQAGGGVPWGILPNRELIPEQIDTEGLNHTVVQLTLTEHPATVGGTLLPRARGVSTDRAASGPGGCLSKSKLCRMFPDCSAIKPGISNRRGSGNSASTWTPYNLGQRRNQRGN